MSHIDLDVGDKQYRLVGEAREAFVRGLKRHLQRRELEAIKTELREVRRESRDLRRRARRLEAEERRRCQLAGDPTESTNGDESVVSRLPFQTDEDGWVSR